MRDKTWFDTVRYTSVDSDDWGRVYAMDGAVTHCDVPSGFERWNICSHCGGRVVWCYECGSGNRALTTCTCKQGRTH